MKKLQKTKKYLKFVLLAYEQKDIMAKRLELNEVLGVNDDGVTSEYIVTK